MQVIHRGLSIELVDDDPRVAIIEAVLFARTLPPPVPSPEEERVTQGWAKFWKALKPQQKRELELLAERRWRAEELEAQLGIGPLALRGQHQSIHSLAKKSGISMRIRVLGRVRADRAYALHDEDRRIVVRLMKAS